MIFVASAETVLQPAPTPSAQAARLNREMHLVLVNRPDRRAAGRRRSVARLFLRRPDLARASRRDQADGQRVLRLISRSGVCLVFSGGGARALAHIGAVQALEEAGVPIDAVGWHRAWAR